MQIFSSIYVISVFYRHSSAIIEKSLPTSFEQSTFPTTLVFNIIHSLSVRTRSTAIKRAMADQLTDCQATRASSRKRRSLRSTTELPQVACTSYDAPSPVRNTPAPEPPLRRSKRVQGFSTALRITGDISTANTTNGIGCQPKDHSSHLQDIRRSGRTSTLTSRARAFFQDTRRTDMPPKFPQEGDEISVRWVLNDEEVWWPATVTKIEDEYESKSTRRGKLIYHRLRNYGVECMTVLFYFLESSKQCLVSPIDPCSDDQTTRRHGHDNDDLSTWVFTDQLNSVKCDDSTYLLHNNDPPSTQVSPTSPHHEQSRAPRTHEEESASRPLHEIDPTPVRKSKSSLQVRHVVSRIEKRSSQSEGNKRVHSPRLDIDLSPTQQDVEDTLDIATPISSQALPLEPVNAPPPTRLHAASNVGKLEGESFSHQLHEISQECDDDAETPPVRIYAAGSSRAPRSDRSPPRSAPVARTSLQARLELLERKMNDVRSSPSHSLSTSAESVLVALKWSMLRQLERPLKEVKLKGLVYMGVAQQCCQATTNCDYSTFRELATSLANRHGYLTPSATSGRLEFSPSYNRIQSGSVASNNMSIMFSTLADLTNFIKVRDEADYRSIISKTVYTEDKSIMRVIGTFRVEGPLEPQPQADYPSSSESTKSVNAVSTQQQLCDNYLRIYVATAPPSQDTSFPDPSTRPPQLHTSILEQRCMHFSTTTRSFQSPWNSREFKSDFKVSCDFDVDGIVPPDQLKNYFKLSWSSLQPPSTKKWTKDVHTVSGNNPGTLTMSFPCVFLSARRSVASLSSVMDSNSDTFIEFRSKVYQTSI